MNKILSPLLIIFCVTFTLSSQAYAYEDDYPEIYNAYWEHRTARWDTSGYASRYEVILYRDGHRVTQQITTRDEINMGRYMTERSGDYYFDVRPYNSYSGWGSWTASDCIYMEGSHYYDDRYYPDRYYEDRYYEDRYYRDRYYDDIYRRSQDISYARNAGPTDSPLIVPNQNGTNIIMPGSIGQPNVIMPGSGQQAVNQQANISVTNKRTITGANPATWYQAADGQNPAGRFIESYGAWFFIYTNGTPATNAWIQYKNKWYYMDLSGTMAVGLYTINGVTYYLQSDGSMAVGTVVIEGITHYFNNTGAMVY